MDKIKTIQEAQAAYDQYCKAGSTLYYYLCSFRNKHEGDIIGKKFKHLDEMEREGHFTYSEVIRLKMEIIEIYSLDR